LTDVLKQDVPMRRFHSTAISFLKDEGGATANLGIPIPASTNRRGVSER